MMNPPGTRDSLLNEATKKSTNILKIHHIIFFFNFYLYFCSLGEEYKYDRNFRGPLAKRSCTDIICLLFFIVFLGAFGYAAFYAHQNGNLNKILIPRDSNGYQCGEDSEVLDTKFLFFFDLSKCADPLVPINGCPTPQICVKQCPQETFLHDINTCNQNIEAYKKRLFCTRDVDVNSLITCAQIDQKIKDKKCAEWYLKSEPCK